MIAARIGGIRRLIGYPAALLILGVAYVHFAIVMMVIALRDRIENRNG